ncbi:MAG: ferritin-like domain-containing protein [Xanthomonadales bacterium]|nr:hypothetical protein [Xanthomonadales bacterium]MCC6593786.1 ferritin-like domain-containing protein [Xanthomonadales bacterium]MCE7930077.1 DUF455 family protein [Xanthomonadales bacterium PRO6]
MVEAIHHRQLARECLLEADVAAKLARTAVVSAAIASGACPISPEGGPAIERIEQPGRPSQPALVPPARLAQRKLHHPEGRAALVHAVAHIEFNAINLAWDAVYRFPGMPAAYYRDWASVAADEARHFALLQARLAELGHTYGDFPAHDGLWQMALDTDHDPLLRMALVPRVLEARGLDVTPGMIERLQRAGDAATVASLEVILREEVRHVAIGTRWFRHLCGQRGEDPVELFPRLLREHAVVLRLPFNEAARMAAGFVAEELSALAAIAR